MVKPFIFTLFGSTGDLTQKKIMPALFKLFMEGRFADTFTIVAFSRRDWSDQQYRDFIRPFIEKEGMEEELKNFLQHVVYTEGHFQDAASFQKLQEVIDSHDKIGKAKKLFYFAVQPEFYDDIVTNLAATNILSQPSSYVLVEKPFGHDETSAKELEATFEKYIKPEQLLRVDHYLAKEGLRTLEKAPIDPKNIETITIRILEQIGIEGRGDFYDRVGALMDVGQNHMMEMLATVLMDHHAKNIHQARAQALKALSLDGNPVFGQYEGYLDEPEVKPTSQTETYFKLQLKSLMPAWQHISIIMEAGKAMAEKCAEVVLSQKDGTHNEFDIQNNPSGRDAYELLIEEAVNSLHDYFVSFGEVVAAWHILEPILKNRATLVVKKYPQGTNGPTL